MAYYRLYWYRKLLGNLIQKHFGRFIDSNLSRHNIVMIYLVYTSGLLFIVYKFRLYRKQYSLEFRLSLRIVLI